MNLTDYSTPRTDAAAETRIVKGKPREIVDADEMRDLERQAAAWRAVAEGLRNAYHHEEIVAACKAFDAIKAELEKP